MGVGLLTSKYLADHGAEVIRIESSTYPEALAGRPVVDDVPASIGPVLRELQQAKLGASGESQAPASGPELMRRLIATCDVVTESFTPGTLRFWARLGLAQQRP